MYILKFTFYKFSFSVFRSIYVTAVKEYFFLNTHTIVICLPVNQLAKSQAHGMSTLITSFLNFSNLACNSHHMLCSRLFLFFYLHILWRFINSFPLNLISAASVSLFENKGNIQWYLSYTKILFISSVISLPFLFNLVVFISGAYGTFAVVIKK